MKRLRILALLVAVASLPVGQTAFAQSSPTLGGVLGAWRTTNSDCQAYMRFLLRNGEVQWSVGDNSNNMLVQISHMNANTRLGRIFVPAANSPFGIDQTYFLELQYDPSSGETLIEMRNNHMCSYRRTSRVPSAFE